MPGAVIGDNREFEGAVKPSSIEKDVYDSEIFGLRTISLPLNLQERHEYSTGLVTYSGYAAPGLAEGTDGWLLFKYEWSGSDMVKKTVCTDGNWTNRASETYS